MLKMFSRDEEAAMTSGLTTVAYIGAAICSS